MTDRNGPGPELRSCVKVEVDVLGSTVPNSPYGLCRREAAWEGWGGGGGGREREREIRMIYSFRPLSLMKGCGWMTYHLTVHTIVVPMGKKTNKLMTMYLTPY